MATKIKVRTPLEIFFYWIKERHFIYHRRFVKKWPAPWTNDPIMREYKFTNVFRNLDRVTKELHRMVKMERRNFLDILLFQVMLFRMFNWPETYADLAYHNLHNEWSAGEALKVLRHREKKGRKIFTGAYIITNSGSTQPKIKLVCNAMNVAWRKKKAWAKFIKDSHSIEQTTGWLAANMPMAGKFIAYEIATDLRWTPLLDKADDYLEWANPGPGARRGLNRIHGRDVRQSIPERMLLQEMQDLLKMAPKHLPKDFPELEMRDIEHSLCEFDKYMRVMNGEGRPRSKFVPFNPTIV